MSQRSWVWSDLVWPALALVGGLKAIDVVTKNPELMTEIVKFAGEVLAERHDATKNAV